MATTKTEIEIPNDYADTVGRPPLWLTAGREAARAVLTRYGRRTPAAQKAMTELAEYMRRVAKGVETGS